VISFLEPSIDIWDKVRVRLDWLCLVSLKTGLANQPVVRREYLQGQVHDQCKGDDLYRLAGDWAWSDRFIDYIKELGYSYDPGYREYKKKPEDSPSFRVKY